MVVEVFSVVVVLQSPFLTSSASRIEPRRREYTAATFRRCASVQQAGA